jgi:AbrB family transcriptional regulator (stage V sporulation protein T)
LKATGIVRRIDDLGRVVIPKEIRRTLRIREGAPLEIFVDREGGVILKKYSPIEELGEFAKEYADSLYEAIGNIVLIADQDNIIAVAGTAKKELLNKPVDAVVEKVMEERKPILISETKGHPFCESCLTAEEQESYKYTSEAIAPIIVDGEASGAVIICSRDPNVKVGELEFKLATTAAGFLAKQMGAVVAESV